MPETPKPPDLWEQVQVWIFQTFGLQGLVVLALLTGAFALWWNWETISKLPCIARVLAWRKRHPVPKADPNRFSVSIARITGDADDTLSNQIFEVLGEFNGIEPLFLDRTLASAGRLGEVEQSKGAEEARTYLRQSGASVLIWGKVIDADKRIARLFLTTASSAHDAAGRQVAPEIGITVCLPDIFWEDLAKVLRLVVVSRAAGFDGSRYVADRLPSFIAATERLLAASRDRPGWDADARGATLMALADARQTLGVQSGQNSPLEQAAETYREALREWPHERVPLYWAMTQNNLGTALAELGERESGTVRLEEAVTAYRAALEVFEAGGAEYYGSGTRANLDRAQALLAERLQATAEGQR